MILRQFKWGDFGAVHELINAAAAQDRTRRLAENVLRDTLSLLSANRFAWTVVAVASNSRRSLMGFAWWSIEGDDRSIVRLEGWVHPNWRRRGVGIGLITSGESFARQHKKTRVTARLYEDIPGGAALLRFKGYEEVRRFYLMSVQFGREIGRENNLIAPPPGIELRSFHSDDLPAVVAANNAFFDDHWGSHPSSVESFEQMMIKTRPHDPDLWILAWKGNQLVGCCLCHASREFGPEDGWIAIVGVDLALRGQGLGRAMLSMGFQKLRESGFQSASLHVDAENIPALRLYRAMGMEIARTRIHFNKFINLG